MKFLSDQDVFAVTISFRRQLGHEVVTAAELGLSRATDSDLLTRSNQENRLFITRNKDFGSLVFVEPLGKGVIFIRITPTTVQAVHHQLKILLQAYSEKDLKNAFVVVEPGQYRFRKLA